LNSFSLHTKFRLKINIGKLIVSISLHFFQVNTYIFFYYAIFAYSFIFISFIWLHCIWTYSETITYETITFLFHKFRS